ncbi:hypothetical protein RD792_009875 [Penstemon davidsonii]|uniref:Alkyl transferase n=1 Tax=Penstemon davidsonii TaxID=160366 RepID=A0ABR0D224_9LAMI|nr:hypothetical protein RD792_009875 [Penstemon davidsonii]
MAMAGSGEVVVKESQRSSLPKGLEAELMPKHVALIADGNRRWAKERGLSVELGHRAGKYALMELAHLSSIWGINVLSVFLFSTENWTRPKEEVSFLMNLLEELIDFDMCNMRISCIGDRSKLPESLSQVMNSVEEKTKCNKGLHLIFALNYSGRYDIIQATKTIARKVEDGIIKNEDINESLFEKELFTNCSKFSAPDLVIRTSGEQRISNFMLWQLAYSELIFSHKKFPEFEEQDYVDALISFQKRDRRFGGK